MCLGKMFNHFFNERFKCDDLAPVITDRYTVNLDRRNKLYSQIKVKNVILFIWYADL